MGTGSVTGWFSREFSVCRRCLSPFSDAYPVVNSSGELVGVIRYRDLSYALFDRTVGSLVRAADVTTRSRRVLYPDDPVARAFTMFQVGKDDCVPVIAREEPHRLLGIVRHRDVLRMLIRGQINSG